MAQPSASASRSSLGPRVISALALAPVALILVWLGGWALAAFTGFVAILMIFEWSRLTAAGGPGWARSAAIAVLLAALLSAALGAFGWALAMVLLGAAAAGLSGQPRTVTVFENARIIVDAGRAPIERGSLVVQNGRVTGVGARGAVNVPANAVRIDLTGKTVMPAIVNAHVHLGFQRGELFAAVHASNLTKEPVEGLGKARKGPAYQPPYVRKALGLMDDRTEQGPG